MDAKVLKIAAGVTAVLAASVLVLSLSATERAPACPKAAACPADQEQCCTQCPVRTLAAMALYLDVPEALLAKSDELGLSTEQQARLNTILKEARTKAVAVLTADQQAKLGQVPAEPVILGRCCASDPGCPQATADTKGACCAADGGARPCGAQ